MHRMPIVEVKDAVKGPARSFRTVHRIHTIHRIKLPLKFKGQLPESIWYYLICRRNLCL